MTECPAGRYCPASSTTTTQCPAGTYRDKNKATAFADCHICPPGKYCTIGSSLPTADCSAGYFCKNTLAGATTASPANSLPNFGICPTGHYCPAGTADPLQCPPGTFLASTGNTNVGSCTACTAGSYCESPGLSAV